MKVFSVYDSKTEAYLKPFYMQTKGEAVRAFEEVVNTKDHQFNKYPGDFTLFEIGEYDELKGELKSLNAKINWGTAIEYKKQADVHPINQQA